MASTVAHDAHNLLVVGTNDADMALAANTLAEVGGGMVVVADGEVLGLGGTVHRRPHELPGRPCHEREGASCLEKTWAEIGCTMPSPFMTMALIPLACLPELRLTNRGLVRGLHHLPIRRLGGGRRLTAQRAITPRNGGGSSWSEPPPLKRIRIRHHREGPVVHTRHVHHGAELPRRHGEAVSPGQLGEVLVQPPGDGRVGRVRERGGDSPCGNSRAAA